jgi:hypothetical protein
MVATRVGTFVPTTDDGRTRVKTDRGERTCQRSHGAARPLVEAGHDKGGEAGIKPASPECDP